MHRFYFFHNRSSMIINDSHIFRVSVHPFETDPPLLIDPNAMLPLPVSRECFQPIGRRHSQVLNRRASVQHLQLAIGCLLNIRRQTLGKFTSENLFRFFAGKTFNHTELGYNAYRYPSREIIHYFVTNISNQRRGLPSSLALCGCLYTFRFQTNNFMTTFILDAFQIITNKI